MVELLLEFLGETLFHLAIYLPGICISAVTGRSPNDLGEGVVIAISVAFWCAVIVLGLVCWGAVSWFSAVLH